MLKVVLNCFLPVSSDFYRFHLFSTVLNCFKPFLNKFKQLLSIHLNLFYPFHPFPSVFNQYGSIWSNIGGLGDWGMNDFYVYCILFLYCDARRDIQWYTALTKGKSRGQSPRDILGAQAIFYCISWLKSHYRQSQLQIKHWPSWEINTGRVDSPYCPVD